MAIHPPPEGRGLLAILVKLEENTDGVYIFVHFDWSKGDKFKSELGKSARTLHEVT